MNWAPSEVGRTQGEVRYRWAMSGRKGTDNNVCANEARGVGGVEESLGPLRKRHLMPWPLFRGMAWAVVLGAPLLTDERGAYRHNPGYCFLQHAAGGVGCIQITLKQGIGAYTMGGSAQSICPDMHMQSALAAAAKNNRNNSIASLFSVYV